jgi:CDP-diacylglycerol--serine O-phosphatidyltransferase
MEDAPIRTKPPRRGAYLLPSLFTVGNIFCGFLALTESFRAGQILPTDYHAASLHFDSAAKAIGFAVLFDGLDGRIARMMGTTSAFGRELDSIADAITFGLAPAFLAYAWGVQAALPADGTKIFEQLSGAGWLISFIYVVCAVSRLARFNIQTTPSTAGFRADHKSFVGLPTPAAAGLIAAIVHVVTGYPVSEWVWVPFWLVVLLAVSFLMVSTWRYSSFKELDLRRKRKFAVVVGFGSIIALIWFYSQPVLLIISATYVLSGIFIKLASIFRRSRPEPTAKVQSA